MRPRFLAVLGLASATLAMAGSLVPADAGAASRYAYPVQRGFVATASTPSPTVGNRTWKLVYKDDFNHALSSRAWDVYNQGGSSNPTTEWWTQSHVVVSGGQVHINGYVDRKVMSDGRIVSGGLGLWQRPQKYGKYEILARMQACTDVKYVWMLWPYSNRWPQDGEIDFAEDEGGNRALTTASLSYAASDGQRATAPQDYATPVGGFSAWHVIGVEWSPHSVRYTLDGRAWGKTHTTHIPRTPMVLVMQTEGKVLPRQVNLAGGSCNAQIGWVAQWAYTGR